MLKVTLLQLLLPNFRLLRLWRPFEWFFPKTLKESFFIPKLKKTTNQKPSISKKNKKVLVCYFKKLFYLRNLWSWKTVICSQDHSMYDYKKTRESRCKLTAPLESTGYSHWLNFFKTRFMPFLFFLSTVDISKVLNRFKFCLFLSFLDFSSCRMAICRYGGYVTFSEKWNKDTEFWTLVHFLF